MCFSEPDLPDPVAVNPAPPPAAKTALNIGRNAQARKKTRTGARKATTALRVPLLKPRSGSVNVPR